MRVTALTGDVDRIAEADRALRTQLAQAGATALQVDRGELSPASARTLAAVARSELRAALDGLKKVAGAADNPVCAGLMELLENLSAALGGIARGSDGSAVLSGRLRCCHVDGTLRLIGFLNGLRE